jgi:hypothetical protein
LAELISEIWAGLRAAGIPEVMLYLPDQSASRCHWDDTVMLGGTRVALVADQERKIVRILAVDSCIGIGVPSPKGVDPSGYKAIVYGKLNGTATDDVPAPAEVEEPVAAAAPVPAPPSAPAPTPPEPTPRVDPAPARWGNTQRTTTRYGGGAPSGVR